MRFAAAGVKPLVVPRWTLYRTTPTLSVAAVQVSDAVVPETFAASPLGAVGAVASATVALAWFDAALMLPVGCAMRFAASGVKPLVVLRWTLYRVTPTSSVEPVQLRLTVLPVTGAARPLGAVGAVVSTVTVAVASFEAAPMFPAAS